MGKSMSIPYAVVTWLVIGILVAINWDYGHQLENSSQVATFAAAVFLWPLVVLGGKILVQF
jgi:hypothetical protein